MGLYFENEGLVKAPEACFSRALSIDPETYLPAQELAAHYQRLSRLAYREAARRLDGHPRTQGYLRLIDVSEKVAPDVAGSGTVGRPGHAVWTEDEALELVGMVLAMERHRESAEAGTVSDPVEPADEPQDVAQQALHAAQHPIRLYPQEDDGDAA